MTSGVYIKGISAISPQRSFGRELLQEKFSSEEGNRRSNVEPDYLQFIDAKQIRRMSHVIKMGVTTSIASLKDAGIETPDAVIVGTALGCLGDTYGFLSKMVTHQEEMLSPTAFIHSTHNSIAAQVALHYQCRGYNSTYVHRSLSFESALADAMMLLEEKSASNVLVGGTDEIIDASFTIMHRLGYFRKSNEATSGFEPGYAAGEGSAFFTLVNQPNPGCYAQILDSKSLSFGRDEDAIGIALSMLEQHSIHSAPLVLAGLRTPGENDPVLEMLNNHYRNNLPVFHYKTLCGEYGTAPAFALWLASVIMKDGVIPGKVNFVPGTATHILIYNHTDPPHYSFTLLGPC